MGTVFLMGIGAFSETYHEREQVIIPEHTHQDPYNYQQIKPATSMTLSASIALSNAYGDLERKVQQAVDLTKLIKVVDEENEE